MHKHLFFSLCFCFCLNVNRYHHLILSAQDILISAEKQGSCCPCSTHTHAGHHSSKQHFASALLLLSTLAHTSTLLSSRSLPACLLAIYLNELNVDDDADHLHRREGSVVAVSLDIVDVLSNGTTNSEDKTSVQCRASRPQHTEDRHCLLKSPTHTNTSTIAS